jgi:RNA polymerase sigma-70 factor (ECF subfamily)
MSGEQARLVEALDSLERQDREILRLRHNHRYSNRSAARALDIDEGAAARRYLRALRRLKESLEGRSW